MSEKPRMVRLEFVLGERVKVIEMNGELTHRVSFDFDADFAYDDMTVHLPRGAAITFPGA